MAVAGQLEVDFFRCGCEVRDVGFVGEEDCEGFVGDLFERALDVE